MAGYRPRSLDDINSAYDNEMRASKAIKREASKIEPTAAPRKKKSESYDYSADAEQLIKSLEQEKEKNNSVDDITSAVESFMNSFDKKNQKKNEIPKQVYGTGPSQYRPAYERYNTRMGSAKAPKQPEIRNSNGEIVKRPGEASRLQPPVRKSVDKTPKKAAQPTKDIPRSRADLPGYVPPTPARREQTDRTRDDGDAFSSLMSDYLNVMNDDDEDTARTSWSRKRKEKKAARLARKAEQLAEELRAEDTASENEDENKAAEENHDSFESGFSFINDTERSENEYNEPLYENGQTDYSEPDYDSEQTDYSEPTYEDEQPDYNEPDYEDEQPDYIEPAYEDEQAEYSEPAYEDEQPVYDEPTSVDKSDSKPLESIFDNQSYNSSDNEQEMSFGEESEADDEEETVKIKLKQKPVTKVFRVLLSLVLVAALILTAAVSSLSLLFRVNEAKAAVDGNYYFTAENSSASAGITSGDLVICKPNVSAEQKSAVVYVDRENKKFAFGKNSGAVTEDDGEIYYIIDDASAVSRNDVLGTVSKTVPSVGKVISLVFSGNNHLIATVALLAVCIVLIFVVFFAMKPKTKKVKSSDLNEEESDNGDAENEDELTDKTEADENSGDLFEDDAQSVEPLRSDEKETKSKKKKKKNRKKKNKADNSKDNEEAETEPEANDDSDPFAEL